MSWLFSQVLVEEFSAACCLDGGPCVQLSVMPTPHRFSRNDRMMGCYRLSRFGLTCAVLTPRHGEALLTWYRAVSRARTLRSAAMAQELKEANPAYGNTWSESSAWFDLRSCGWKTHPCSLSEVLPWSSVILPKWGMTRSGDVFQRLNAERRIVVSGSGSWPTPVASMAKGSSPGSLIRKCGRDRSRDRLDHALMAAHGGHPNPEWVEWLMGWPIGWTDLKPLAMDRFQQWWMLHSDPCGDQEHLTDKLATRLSETSD